MSLTPEQRANPLINRPALPYGAPAFDLIKTEHFLPAVEWAIEKARANVAAIAANPDLPTFENTIEALEFSSADLSFVKGVFETIAAHMITSPVQDIEKTIANKVTKFSNDVRLDAALFKRIRAVHDSKTGQALTGEKAMLLKKTYDGFVQNGALLDDAGKQTLRALDEKLADLSTQFGKNSTNADAAYMKHITDPAILQGVPQRILDRLAKNATDKKLPGGWAVTEGNIGDLLTYCDNRDLRRDLYMDWRDLGNQAPYDNRPVILEMISLRHERARLLGKPNHSAFILQQRMAKDPATVQKFLEDNLAVYMPAAKVDVQEVRDFVLKEDGLADLQAYDASYYSRRLKEQKFSVDMEEIRAYFSLENVLNGQAVHNKKLFDVEMVPADGKYPVWHPDVKVYESRDTKTGQTIALRYNDSFLRQGDCKKRSGAWMNAIRNRGMVGGQDMIPIITNSCNFSEGVDGNPCLLSPGEVTTVYHESGHGNHGMLAEGTYPSLTGTNVAWDFVELPSQLQENWALEKEVLATYAFHHETGQPIPDDMVQKLKDMANFQAGYIGLRQTNLGLLDMAFHATDPATIKSVEDVERDVASRASLFPLVGAPFSSGFGHLFSDPVGYSSGYYSYKWAEVLDADAFTKFKDDLYNRQAADELRATIYSKGGTVEPGALFRAFMGRDPDQQALFRRQGLASALAPVKQPSPAPNGP